MKKTMMNVFGWVLFLMSVPASVASADGEIHYAHIEDVKDTRIEVQYKGPSGIENYTCEADTLECVDYGTTTPHMFPSLIGGDDYPNSPDGNYGLVTYEVDDDTTYHLVYSLKEDTGRLEYIIPFYESVTRVKFSWASDSVVLFAENGLVAHFSIPTHTLSTTTLSQTSFPLRSLSPHGTYLSAYNYSDGGHRIWNLITGEEFLVPDTAPSYVEFSQDEQTAVFTDSRDGFQTIYTVDMNTAESGTLVATRLFTDDFTVEDYLFFKDDLYMVANKNHPLEWSLYRYSFETQKVREVAEQVSYGDYIRPIGKLALSFLTIEGKNSHVALYDPVDDEVRVIRPVEKSPAYVDISQALVEFGGVHGVLLEPTKRIHSTPLFVWLHGGPQRQTSVGYHSYLSYAVYDEMLERLVQGGATVLKLDYTGSYGYGSEHIESLTNNIGVTEVQDVLAAVAGVQKTLHADDVYLIGNSYGGYLSLRALVEDPEVFSGAISINGVFDWFTLLERIPSSQFKKYFDGVPELHDLDYNFQQYLNASIYSGIPDLKDEKILLIYGEEDSTVPTWQTREFYYFAKSLEKDVRLLSFSDEDHILRKRENLDALCLFITEGLTLEDVQCLQ